MTRQEIRERAAATWKEVGDSWDSHEPKVALVERHLVAIVRATLEEAARAVCERCAVETPALGDDGSYWHSPEDYGSTWCDASPIYELIAALESEGSNDQG